MHPIKGLSYFTFLLFALYGLAHRHLQELVFATGIACVLYGFTKKLPASLLMGALFGVIAVLRSHHVRLDRLMLEGFADASANENPDAPTLGVNARADELEGEEEQPKDKGQLEVHMSRAAEPPAEADVLARDAAAQNPNEPFVASIEKAKPVENRDRRELFKLGSLPNENSGKGEDDYHLDAGTSFLNAYKSLSPDQITAMGKDTQDLIRTQQGLIKTLHTFKRLLQDSREMMKTFEDYFKGFGGLSALTESKGGAPNTV
jgi:hypothetical protein